MTPEQASVLIQGRYREALASLQSLQEVLDLAGEHLDWNRAFGLWGKTTRLCGSVEPYLSIVQRKDAA